MEQNNSLAKCLTEQSDENADSRESTHKIDENYKLKQANPVEPRKEIGGPKGPEPTRYGDWEKNGRCIDF
jgi:hypothetical protein